MIPDFILVDDEPINNIISKTIIKKVFPTADIKAFIDPHAALIYIHSLYAGANASDAVLFLDINMPLSSGWEFLDAFERFDSKVKEHLKVYILSSSDDHRDKQRAAENKNVLDYIEQPLTQESLKNVLSKL